MPCISTNKESEEEADDHADVCIAGKHLIEFLDARTYIYKF